MKIDITFNLFTKSKDLNVFNESLFLAFEGMF